MLDNRHSIPLKHVHRLQAVLALFRGKPGATVSTQYRMALSTYCMLMCSSDRKVEDPRQYRCLRCR
jgi:hypothetical protein